MLPSRQSPAFSEEGAHVVDPAGRPGCAEVHVPERAHDEADIDEYVARFGELLDELTRPTK